MSKINYRIFLPAALLVVALCLSKVWAYGPSDPFRVPMESGFGPNSPGPTPAGGWIDVGDWQIFLKTHGQSALMGASYPNNTFDGPTEQATSNWQGQNGLTQSGKCDPPTFAKAGLANPVATPPAYLKLRDEKSGRPLPTGTTPLPPPPQPAHLFRTNLQFGCGPNGPLGAAPDGWGPYWDDVSDWQLFLMKLRKWTAADFKARTLGHGHPNNNFDSATETATREFQRLMNLDENGIVDNPTYQAATTATNTFPETYTLKKTTQFDVGLPAPPTQ
jgi:hypothetical protein